jgi:hypothetical protein
VMTRPSAVRPLTTISLPHAAQNGDLVGGSVKRNRARGQKDRVENQVELATVALHGNEVIKGARQIHAILYA